MEGESPSRVPQFPLLTTYDKGQKIVTQGQPEDRRDRRHRRDRRLTWGFSGYRGGPPVHPAGRLRTAQPLSAAAWLPSLQSADFFWFFALTRSPGLFTPSCHFVTWARHSFIATARH